MTDLDELDDDYDFVPCPTCRGSGFVNPLTCPPSMFCVGTTECPSCEGSGEAP